MKKCSKCGERKAKSQFHKRARSFDGLTSTCKVCRCVGREHDRRFRTAEQKLLTKLATPEKRRIRYAARKDEINEARRARLGSDPAYRAKRNDAQKKYYWTHLVVATRRNRLAIHLRRRERREYMKRWSVANADHLKKYHHDYHLRNAAKKIQARKEWERKNATAAGLSEGWDRLLGMEKA